MKSITFWIGILAVTLVGGTLQATDLAVPGQYPDLSSAYQASVEGDRILVDDGVYTGTVNTIRLNGKSLYLVGNGNNVVFDLENSRQFITTGNRQTLQHSVYIENLNVLFGPQNNPSMIINCEFEAQQSNFYGHGNTVIQTGLIGKIQGCKFSSNQGNFVVDLVNHGKFDIHDCQFEHNLGVAINAVDTRLVVRRSEFLDNDIGVRGTASPLTSVRPIDIDILNSRFYINRIGIEIGDITNFLLDKTKMMANETAVISTGCERVTIESSVIALNGFVGSSNSAVRLSMRHSLQRIAVLIVDCTIADNFGHDPIDINATNMKIVIMNNIVWNPRARIQMTGQWAAPWSVIDYNLIKGGGYGGINNIDADPLFAKADRYGFDYGLTASSPAVNRARFFGGGLDINGVSRQQDGFPDMGASEYCRHISRITIMGSTELLFHGQPGELVGLAVSTQWDLAMPTPTPLGDFLLDLSHYYFVNNIGTIGGNGVFSMTYTSSVTSPPFVWGQALIGPEFGKNALLLEIQP